MPLSAAGRVEGQVDGVVSWSERTALQGRVFAVVVVVECHRAVFDVQDVTASLVHVGDEDAMVVGGVAHDDADRKGSSGDEARRLTGVERWCATTQCDRFGFGDDVGVDPAASEKVIEGKDPAPLRRLLGAVDEVADHVGFAGGEVRGPGLGRRRGEAAATRRR